MDIYRGTSRVDGDPVNLSRWLHLTAPFRLSGSSRVKMLFDIYSSSKNKVREREEKKNLDKIDDVRSSLFFFFFLIPLFSPIWCDSKYQKGEIYFNNVIIRWFTFHSLYCRFPDLSELPRSLQLNEIKDIPDNTRRKGAKGVGRIWRPYCADRSDIGTAQHTFSALGNVDPK